MITLNHTGWARQGKQIINGVNFIFEQGGFYGLIGPNGAGKSTLLQLIAGTEAPHIGTVRRNGKDMFRENRKRLARELGVLLQDGLPPAIFTVRETIEMGRYPYQNWAGNEKEDSTAYIETIIDNMGLISLQHRTLEQLSGGERQRTALAKLMAQNPAVLLLDEPTTYLDIGYQVQLLDQVQQWRVEKGLTVIAVLHDLNLAALYCDKLVMLDKGQIYVSGTPTEVLTTEHIKKVYGTNVTIISHPILKVPQVLLNSQQFRTE